MDFISVLLIALGLAMDAFAVALGVGTTRQDIWFRPGFRLSFHFGLFQFLMPILGWLGGATLAHFIGAWDHWIAFVLLAYVGGKMVKESFGEGQVRSGADPTRRWTLVMLAIATSIDALAVGLSLAMIRVDILYPSLVIGLVAAAMTALGLALGKRLGVRFGQRMELAGGLILIGIGLRVVWEHLA